MKNLFFLVSSLILWFYLPHNGSKLEFNNKLDYISLHYDFANDLDDGHSAAADRSVLEKICGKNWIVENVMAISGTCGTQCNIFDHTSNILMKKIWKTNWLLAIRDRERYSRLVSKAWKEVILRGGKIFIKEGGQSDFTALVVKKLLINISSNKIKNNIIVVQHSKWNEDHTNKEALDFIKNYTTYIKIQDANSYLKKIGGDKEFIKAALSYKYWRIAFYYLNPTLKLDFSDTGALLYILGYNKMTINKFKKIFLNRK